MAEPANIAPHASEGTCEKLRRENEELRRDLQKAMQSLARFFANSDVTSLLNRDLPPMLRGHVAFPDGTTVVVEIADTRDRLALGLMFREALPQDEGMLFVYPEPGYYSFWMKNTRIALDMIWLDASGRVIALQERALPCTTDPCPHYWPLEPLGLASYVIEVPAGFVDDHRLRRGDIVDLTDVHSIRSLPEPR